MVYDLIYTHKAEKNLIIPSKSEILRYLGEKGDESEILTNLIDDTLEDVVEKSSPMGAFVLKKINTKDDKINIGDEFIISRNLSKNLADCHSVLIFSLTIGAGVDRLMQSLVSKPASEFVVSATGSALIESYADSFNNEIKEYFSGKSQYLRPRFSPGYGDFSHSAQSFIIDMTDASKRCGIYLTKALMLTPVKSITGVIGISETNINCKLSGCETCNKINCISRRGN